MPASATSELLVQSAAADHSGPPESVAPASELPASLDSSATAGLGVVAAHAENQPAPEQQLVESHVLS